MQSPSEPKASEGWARKWNAPMLTIPGLSLQWILDSNFCPSTFYPPKTRIWGQISWGKISASQNQQLDIFYLKALHWLQSSRSQELILIVFWYVGQAWIQRKNFGPVRIAVKSIKFDKIEYYKSQVNDRHMRKFWKFIHFYWFSSTFPTICL